MKQHVQRRRLTWWSNLARCVVTITGVACATSALGHIWSGPDANKMLCISGSDHSPDRLIRESTEQELVYRQGLAACMANRFSCANDMNQIWDEIGSIMEALNDRAQAYCRKGQPDLAMADVNKALKLRATTRGAPSGDTAEHVTSIYAMVYNTRADIWIKIGQFDKAIADYQKSLQIEDLRIVQFPLIDAYFEQAQFF